MTSPQEKLRSLTSAEMQSAAVAGALALDAVPQLTAERDAALGTIAQLRRQLQEAPVSTPVLDNLDGAQRIDSFPGKTDNEKLDAALAYVGAVRGRTSITPPLIAPTRRFETSGTRVVPDGLAIGYPWAPNTDFQRGAETARVDWRHTSGPDKPMFVLDHDTYTVALERFTVLSTAGGVFFDCKGHTLWTSTLRDLGGTGWKHWLGTPQQQFLNTLITMEGTFNLNNTSGQQVTWGGSDSASGTPRFAMDVGGGAGNKTAFAAAQAYLFALAWQEKSELQGFYITAEGAANAMKVDGRKSANRLLLDKSIIEGRNARQPCTRDLLRIKGGLVFADGLSVNFAKKPTDIDHGAPVVVEGKAKLHLTRFTHAPANGVDEDVPVILVKTGGKLAISGAEVAENAVEGGAAWKDQRIRVAVEKGATVRCFDDSIVQVPV